VAWLTAAQIDRLYVRRIRIEWCYFRHIRIDWCYFRHIMTVGERTGENEVGRAPSRSGQNGGRSFVRVDLRKDLWPPPRAIPPAPRSQDGEAEGGKWQWRRR
jgi:hypothetical protein